MNDAARKDLAEAMEAAIDAMSLSDVLDVLFSICGEKAEHVRSNWQDHPTLPRKKIPNYSGNGTMYPTDTRVAWCDWIDYLSKSGAIPHELAQRAALD